LYFKIDIWLRNKLRPVEGARYQSENHETCLDGTRTAELERINKWEKDDNAKVVYWLSGPAGSGKSTIAQTFAGHSAKQGRLGANFFCSRDFQDRRNIRHIFPTLAYQLALSSPGFRDALIPILHDNPDVCNDSPAQQFDILIVRPLQVAKIHTTVIIDALDECEDNLGQPASTILSVLGRYTESTDSVKFFITGRPEPPIRTGFRLPSLRPQTEVLLLHEVEQTSVDGDIELYLRTHLSKIAGRSHCDLPFPWPADDEIKLMIKICSSLFIVASIIVKYVTPHFYDPEERLKTIISNLDNSVLIGKSGLDGTYDIVLLQGFKEIGTNEKEFYVYLRLVVGSIVVAFDPLSCAGLAAILGIKKNMVWAVLNPLHSIFIVPDSESMPIRICHKSLADYLQDENRCKDPRFHINSSDIHLELGLRCLRLMNTSLKRNICDVPRYAMNEEVHDLDERREKYIGGGLEYGCGSWAKHLRLASRNGENIRHVVESLRDFFYHHLLEWLEVLSIVGDLRCAVYSLHDVTLWLVDVSLSTIFFHLDMIKLLTHRLRHLMRTL
jgi:NACHT domain